MFTLNKKKKQIEKKPTTAQSTWKKQGNDLSNLSEKRQEKKAISKKIQKKVFEDPFNYKIQILPPEQSIQVIELLVSYFKRLRQKLPYKPPREGLVKTIKFEQNLNLKIVMSPLICKEISIGVRRTNKLIYSSYLKNKETESKNKNKIESLAPQLVIIFYEEQKHQIFIELFCLLKMLNFPYLILRTNQQINRSLGVRSVGSLCLNEQQFANSLVKYLGKSLADVPWVLQMAKILNDHSPESIDFRQ